MIEFTPFEQFLNNLDELILLDHFAIFSVLAFMLKCLIVSFYCVLLYLLIKGIRRVWQDKLSVRAHYYSWHALLLAFPLSMLPLNNSFKIPLYDLINGDLGIFFRLAPVQPTTNEEHLLWLQQMDGIFSAARVIRILLYIATVAWLIAVLIKCLRQVILNRRLWREIDRQTPFDDQDGLQSRAAQALGMRGENIKVFGAAFVRSPVSYGLFRKAILLPHDYQSRYTSSELYMLLLHEMSHIKNHDTVKLQLIAALECFIWPLRRMKKQFVRDSEILCDNRVLGVCNEEQNSYSELIVRECASKHVVKGVAFSDSYHTIKSRLDAIEQHPPERHRMAAAAIIIAVVLAGSAAYAAGHPASWLVTNYTDDPTYPQEGVFDANIIYIDPENGETWIDSFVFLSMPNIDENGEFVEFSLGIDQSTPEAEVLRSACHYDYETRVLRVDKLVLYEFLAPHMEENLAIAGIEFSAENPVVMDLTRAGGGTQTISFFRFPITADELVEADKENRYAYFPRPKRSALDWILIFIAHWL